MYDVDITEWEGIDSKNRRAERCDKKRLVEILNDSRYTVWSARWVNPQLDKPKEEA